MTIGRTDEPPIYLVTESGLAVQSGQFQPVTGTWQNEPLSYGLKLILMETGALNCQFPGKPQVTISGPTLCVVWNQDEAEALQCFVTEQRVAYTSVSFTHEMLQHSLAPLVQQQLMSALQLDHAGRPRMHITALPAPLFGLRSQLARLPKQGTVGQLLLQSKALEVMAHTLEALNSATLDTPGMRLNLHDMEALNRVQQLLVQQMDAPPSLQALSLQLGINRRKLTEGFRQLFGVSVYEWLHRHRLDTAWQLLQQGDLNVASVAYQVGFTPAHLSVAFKKRFGVVPKQMRQG